MLAVAGGIVQIEARRAAAIRLRSEAVPVSDSSGPSRGKERVLNAVEPFTAPAKG